MDIVNKLFDSSGFVPRAQCGNWTPELIWTHNVADALIWLAFLAIPLVLVYFVRRRKYTPFPLVFWLFGAFILSCGFTHLMDMVMFYEPLYRLSAAVKVVTAVASLATVVALVRVAPKALALRGPQELEREVAARTAELRKAIDALRAEVEGRKRTGEALDASEERFRFLVEGVKDYAIFMLDPGGNVVSWNPGAERFKGYAADEIIGRHFSCFYPEEDRRAGKPGRLLTAATREGRVEDEGWRLRKDGSAFWADVVITALFDQSGKLRGFAKVTRDMTERKRAEDALREADRRKDNFLMMLAHELRNPLAPIHNSVQVLRLVGPATPSLERARDVIERQTAQLSHLVDDLLSVSRIVQGKVQLRAERLDLGRLVAQCVEDYRPDAERSGLTLDADFPGRPVWVQGDRTRLNQVVGNVLDNAVKFTERGGTVRVTLAPEPPDRVVLTVSDTGVGIEPGELPHVFDSFSQADRSLDRTRGGLGLGLAIVKGLVALHGGTVEAASDGPGKGATFRVCLAEEAEPPPLAPGTDSHAANRSDFAGLRVLVIEDNRDSADSLRMLLELLGCRVTVAYAGPEGVRLARETRPETVLCDIGLPGMDGFAVARALRGDAATATVRMVAVTGYGGEDDRRQSREAGFDLHLTKPVEHSALVAALAPARAGAAG